MGVLLAGFTGVVLHNRLAITYRQKQHDEREFSYQPIPIFDHCWLLGLYFRLVTKASGAGIHRIQRCRMIMS